ncbi:MAG: alanine racemase [Longimicrobiales bacterium]
MSNRERARAWVEVDTGALRANYELVREVVGPASAVIAMVKADGYGLGVARVTRALEPLAPWAYGVATAAEGYALRELGIERPVLVFSPLPPADVELAAASRLTPAISDLASLELWAAAAGRLGNSLDFHVEIDTGMGRAGFDWRETPTWGQEVRSRARPPLRWAGVFTHFQASDAPDPSPTETQWARFEDAVAQLPVSREDLVVHACNGAAALRWPAFAADAVRPGYVLYGGDVAAAGVSGVPRTKPVAALRARIVLVRDVPPGTTAGYGATHASRGWARWATLAIGYGDGLPRVLGNLGEALVRGRRVPLIGRVSMDLTVADVTAVPEVAVGDVATLIGRDGDEEITLEHVAAQANTIGYEILTGLGPRLPRAEVS